MVPLKLVPAEGDDWLAAMTREVLNTRAHVGICDVSTLGKIDIKGSDATEFINRLYSNAFAKLPVGKARYGLMLREDGFVGDDGTTSRLSDTHYFMTTTTGHAAETMRDIEFAHQALWPDLDVQYASVTDQWAQMAIAGPKARDVLSKIVDTDLSNDAFGFLAAKQVKVLGSVPAMLFRISFSGELAYELAVPAGYRRGGGQRHHACGRALMASARTGWRRSVPCALKRALSPITRSMAG